MSNGKDQYVIDPGSISKPNAMERFPSKDNKT